MIYSYTFLPAFIVITGFAFLCLVFDVYPGNIPPSRFLLAGTFILFELIMYMLTYRVLEKRKIRPLFLILCLV